MNKLTVILNVSEKEFGLLQDKVPELGTWSVSKRLGSGLLRVMLSLNEENFAYAGLMAEQNGYFGPEDYISGEFHRAELDIEEILGESPPPLFPVTTLYPAKNSDGRLRLPVTQPDKEPDWLDDELEEDPGGGVRLKSDGENDDLDDDIPF